VKRNCQHVVGLLVCNRIVFPDQKKDQNVSRDVGRGKIDGRVNAFAKGGQMDEALHLKLAIAHVDQPTIQSKIAKLLRTGHRTPYSGMSHRAVAAPRDNGDHQ
jgi:hypothetical protein